MAIESDMKNNNDPSERIRNKKAHETNRHRSTVGTSKKNTKYGPPEGSENEISKHNQKRKEKENAHFQKRGFAINREFTSGLRGMVEEQKNLNHLDVHNAAISENVYNTGIRIGAVADRATHLEYAKMLESCRDIEKWNDYQYSEGFANSEMLRKVNLDNNSSGLRVNEENTRSANRVYESNINSINNINLEREKCNSLISLKHADMISNAMDGKLYLDRNDNVNSSIITNIRAKREILEQTFEDRMFIAEKEYLINKVATEGSEPVVRYEHSPIKYVLFEDAVDRTRKAVYPRSNTLLPDNIRREVTIPLVPVPFFFKEKREGWLRWLGRQFLSPFYRRFEENDINTVKTSFFSCDTEHRTPWYPDVGVATLVDGTETFTSFNEQPFQDSSLGRHFDKRLTLSLLANFRFCGFEWEVIRRMFLSENDFFVRQKLNRFSIQLIHPAIYQQAMKIAIGKKITDVLVSSITTELKWWVDRVPADILINSVNCACQAVQVMQNTGLAAFQSVVVAPMSA